MRHLLPTLALMGLLSVSLTAEEIVPPTPPGPPPGAGDRMAPGPDGGGNDRRALMKDMMDLDMQLRPMREKVAQNPELLKLKTAADDARKAVRTKEDELMAADPAFAALKTKRDQLMEKMSAAGMDPNRPMRKEPKDGKGGKDHPPAGGEPAPAPKL